MKAFKYVLLLGLLIGPANLSYSQEKKLGRIDMVNLPAVVIKSAGDDFSVYLPDRNPDPKVRTLEDSFIAYDLGKNFEGYETYLVYMEVKGGTLSATYNEKGQLISVVENYKDVVLPSKLIYEIYKKYPGWEIVNDKYLYSQEKGDIVKKQYNIKIKKGKESQKLKVHPDGQLIAEN
ncbi:hypothetical protein [Flavobacterium hiemivividum]|uniref:Nicotinate-nucleotide adenylyltransferase n=1 Tax=Flavobacterium hiemivividum TaxID=2541734 RepID=A0A4R5D3R6_9FLAO|nr:hypothetical protein [Flavobacterium hiemivividum]TDE06131.1 hypothetical protein E0F98_00465 [Flavobacterium hiemivividum]